MARLKTIIVGAAAALLIGALVVPFAADRLQAQGSPGVELTTLTDDTQVEPGYPCTVSCFFKLSTLKTYINSGGAPGPSTVTTLTAQAIAGGDASLGVAGQAAAQGGAVAVQGGTSSTSANAGGAISLTGGVPGATGVGGAVTVAGGAGGATSGAGGAVSVTGGAGTAGNANGGNVNLTGGAANGTGTPGEVQFNGNSGVICPSYYFTGTPAATNQAFFVAPRPMRIKSISQVHSAAAGGVSTLTVTKDTSTTAPGAGGTVMTGSFNLNGAANTVQNATVSTNLATTAVAVGDRISVNFANAIQSSAGVVVTVCLAAI